MSDSNILAELNQQIENLKKRIAVTETGEQPRQSPLPFVNYGALSASLTGGSNVLITSLPRSGTITQWTQAVYVATTNSASHYWNFTLSRMDTGAALATFDTSTYTANTWTTYTNSALAVAVTLSMVAVLLAVTKSGSPGALSLGTPYVVLS